MPLEDLPPVDEHAVVVGARPQAVWEAVLRALRDTFATAPARTVARLLRCDPASTTGWDHPAAGSTVPGFRVLTAEPPGLLVVAGRHRFSRYGIVVRIDPAEGGTRCRAETRAAFPGVPGALYRAAVVGTGGHVVTVRRLLRRIARTAEQTDRSPRRPAPS